MHLLHLPTALLSLTYNLTATPLSSYLPSFSALSISASFPHIQPLTMRLYGSSLPFISALLSLTAASPVLESRDLNSYVATERAIALQGVKDNIGPDGKKVPGAGAGYVVASPSRVDPPCEFAFSRSICSVCFYFRLGELGQDTWV